MRDDIPTNRIGKKMEKIYYVCIIPFEYEIFMINVL